MLVLGAFAASAADAPTSPFDWDRLGGPFRNVMPPGPMTAWSEQQHRAANKVIYRCAILGIMSTDAAKGSASVLRLQASYMSLACEYHVAPADWPGRAKLAATIRKAYAVLRQSEPWIPDPQLAP